MKQLISNYIEENYITSVKELALLKAYQTFTTNVGCFKDEFNLDRADLLEDIEKVLLSPNGYSITTKQELMFTIATALDSIIEYYSNVILENLNSL